MRTLQGAIIGFGYWGPNILRNYQKLSGARITHVSDLLDDNLKTVSQFAGSIAVTTNYHQILQDKEIDFVSIATPLSTHAGIAKDALLAGKHVLLEKPMAMTSRQAKELIVLAKKMRCVLMVGHTFVYAAAVRKMKDILHTDLFGNVLYYDSTRINLGRLQADTNVIWDLAAHDFAILNYMLPYAPQRVLAVGTSPIQKKQAEIAHIFITYEQSITAHIHVSWLSPLKIRQILIGGDRQMVTYNDIEPSEKLRIYDKSVSVTPSDVTPFRPAYRSGDVVIPKLDQYEPLQKELEHFIDCIQKMKKPDTDGYDGLRVVELLEAADLSLQTKKAIEMHD